MRKVIESALPRGAKINLEIALQIYITVKISPLSIWGPNVDFAFPTAIHLALLQDPIELPSRYSFKNDVYYTDIGRKGDGRIDRDDHDDAHVKYLHCSRLMLEIVDIRATGCKQCPKWSLNTKCRRERQCRSCVFPFRVQSIWKSSSNYRL